MSECLPRPLPPRSLAPGPSPGVMLWFDFGKFTSVCEVKLLALSNGDSALLSAKGMSRASSLEQDCTDRETQLGPVARGVPTTCLLRV